VLDKQVQRLGKRAQRELDKKVQRELDKQVQQELGKVSEEVGEQEQHEVRA
jgi:hypothetical protein